MDWKWDHVHSLTLLLAVGTVDPHLYGPQLYGSPDYTDPILYGPHFTSNK